jgi:PAS domain S-box-containing protein
LGAFISYDGLICDITERKLAEEALRNREAFNFALFEYNPVETIVVDREGKITMFNLAKKNSGDKLPSIGEVMYKDYAGKHEIDMFGEMMECIKKNEVKKFSEMKYINRFLSITISPFSEGAIIISEDITERKKAEENIKSSLREKEILLKEIHHRVKNNMQVISSLLLHQADRIEDKKYQDIYYESINRVKTIAAIHDLLYQSEDFSHINFQDYINKICENLFSVYLGESGKIEYITDIRSIDISIDDAIPCGLIINELVSNSLKHGFPDNRKGKITITMKKVKNKKIKLKVGDNGVGLPETFDWENTDSLGLHLVKLLAEVQLEGTIELIRTNGTEFRITFMGD